ncbi:MAG: FAD:protein FMN transferase [Peptoniphilus sp.]|nr:FAD:protein FMN transferase [Peptoniphilus sp.]MDY3117921.1 FAD:protein FMN transferase [Peptoniphilus sp.]
MMKRILALVLGIAVLLTGCGQMKGSESTGVSGKKTQTAGEKIPTERYQATFYDTFDTIVSAMVYADSEKEANAYLEKIHKRYQELDRLYNGFKNFDGVVNVKSVNDKAGQGKVVVDKELYDLLKFSKEEYKKYGETNIAFGAVTSIWQRYREAYEVVSEGETSHDDVVLKEGLPDAKIPTMEELQAANAHTNIEDVVLNDEDHSVEIKDPKLRIDVGAVAKGYATELIGEELRASGLQAGLISAGGNVKIIGSAPEAERNTFGIGLQNPEAITGDGGVQDNMKDIVYANDTSIVTSGDYQRYYIVAGKHYHHLIDPDTLMPANHFRSVSIVTKDSGYADFLSTTVFCLPYEKGRALVDRLDGVEAYWIFADGTTAFTDGLKGMLDSQGATNAQ